MIMAAIPLTRISSVFVNGIIEDSLGITTEITSLVTENVSAPIASSRIKLPDGDNTITVPTGSRGVIITFNEDCNSFKILKGVAGDVGIKVASPLLSLRNSGVFMLLFGASPPASFVIFSASGPGGVDAGFTEFLFF